MNNGEKPNSPSLDSFSSWLSSGVPFSSRPFLHSASILTIVKIALQIVTAKLHLQHGAKKSRTCTQCLKITEKVSFKIASEASCVYILSGKKLIKRAKYGRKCQNWKVKMRHFGWVSNNVPKWKFQKHKYFSEFLNENALNIQNFRIWFFFLLFWARMYLCTTISAMSSTVLRSVERA